MTLRRDGGPKTASVMPTDRFGSDGREQTTKQITFDTAEEIYNLRADKQSR